MKYTINSINQLGIAEFGFLDKTDLIDWVMLDYIFDWQQNPRALSFNGMVWFSYRHFMNEMPLIGIKDKGAISKRVKKLKELGLIVTFTETDTSKIFVKTTEKYFNLTRFKAVDDNQPPVVLNQRTVDDNQPPVVLNQPNSNTNNSNTNNSNKTSLRKSTKAGDEYSEDFEKFWEAYPKKKSKGDAMKAWTKLNPDEQLQQKIISAVFLAKTQDLDWLKDGGQYIPHAATYLNGKRWEDEVITQAQKSPGDGSGQNRGNSSNNGGDYTARKNGYVSKQQQRQDIGAEIFGSAQRSYSKRAGNGTGGHAVCEDASDLLDALDGQFHVVTASENVKV